MYKISTRNIPENEDKNIASLMQELALGIAHDVRNPLAAAKGVLSLMELQHKDDEILLEQTRQISMQIEYASKTLSAFYNMFNPSMPEAQSVSAVSLCRDTVSIFNGLAILNGVLLKEEYKYKGQIYINVQGFTQILINLLKNGIDAASEGDIVCIGIEEEGEKVRIYVRDTGKGMNEETLKNVFQAYFSTKAKGTGLGLNISMHIARYFGWDIEAESEPGKGSLFSVIVPKF